MSDYRGEAEVAGSHVIRVSALVQPEGAHR
jgi:hypothetical protein